MKKQLLSIMAGLLSLASFSQTASNFNCNDCASNNHDLFTELNAGKVVVIVWVMPCSACISGALAAYTEVQNFPTQAVFYLSDDVANTSCTTLSSWATTNGMSTADAKFSNSAVSMTPYGVAGMPKVVVLAGANHTVYYNQNGSAITSSGINSAITAAIAANANGVKENKNNFLISANVYPNPTNTSADIKLNTTKESKVKIEVFNLLGEKVLDVFNGNLIIGENTIKINTSELTNGNYFINLTDGESAMKLKLVVLR